MSFEVPPEEADVHCSYITPVQVNKQPIIVANIKLSVSDFLQHLCSFSALNMIGCTELITCSILRGE